MPYRQIVRVNTANRSREFVEFRERHNTGYFYVMTAVALSFVLGFFGLDLLLQLPNLRQLLAVRIGTGILVLLNLAVYLVNPHRQSRRVAKAHIYLGFFIIAFYSSALSYFAGGVESSYWAGLNFALIFWLTLVPFGWRELTSSALFFILQYNAVMLWGETIINWTLVLQYNAFLFGTLTFGGFVAFYSNRNSMIIHEQTLRIEEEKKKSEELLHNILPPSIAAQLKAGRTTIADEFPMAAVIFADIANFTVLARSIPVTELLHFLNMVFLEFDRLAEKYQIEKIKTIGDAYMAAAGVPTPHADDLEKAAAMALEMLTVPEKLKDAGIPPFKLRIGLQVGPVIAGVIGAKKFIYDLWGDAVNTASRMESSGIPGRIHVTKDVFNVLHNQFAFERCGELDIKGKGIMETYFLTGRLIAQV